MRRFTLAFAVMLAIVGAAEAGGKHHRGHRDRGDDGAALFALGSILAFLAITHPPRVVHPPPRHHVHWRTRDHDVYVHVPGYDPHYRAHRHRHGPRDGRYRPAPRYAAPAPLVISDRHRHGNGGWHTHPLEHPRAFHRH